MMECGAAPKEACEWEVCVKSEPALDGVIIKNEPSWEDSCVKDEPSRLDVCEVCSDVWVKDETSLPDVCAVEPPSSGVCVKHEPSSEAAGARGDSEATAALYADHVVKDELLVLGPALVQPRRELCASIGQTQQEELRGRLTRYQCGYCSHTTEKMSSLISHERKHTGVKLFQCEHCHYKVSNKALLQNHMSTHISDFSRKQHKSSQCKYTVHKTRHSGEKLYKCNQCGYSSVKRNKLQLHVKIHTGEKPYKCGSCTFASAHKGSLKAHGKIHTGEKPYKCGQCSYASTHKRNLKVHEVTHTLEKSYKCGQCSYASTKKGSLTKHEKIHPREKRYKCDQCPYTTHIKYSLKLHNKKHTGEKSYKCGTCSYCVQKGGICTGPSFVYTAATKGSTSHLPGFTPTSTLVPTPLT